MCRGNRRTKLERFAKPLRQVAILLANKRRQINLFAPETRLPNCSWTLGTVAPCFYGTALLSRALTVNCLDSYTSKPLRFEELFHEISRAIKAWPPRAGGERG